MSMAWVAGGIAVAGLGGAIYGANKQANAISDANASNQAAQEKQNDSAWASYLLGKGVAPTTPVTAGVMPTAGNFTAVNTRLPIWANMNTPTGTSRWQKVGTPRTSPAPGTLNIGNTSPTTGVVLGGNTGTTFSSVPSFQPSVVKQYPSVGLQPGNMASFNGNGPNGLQLMYPGVT